MKPFAYEEESPVFPLNPFGSWLIWGYIVAMLYCIGVLGVLDYIAADDYVRFLFETSRVFVAAGLFGMLVRAIRLYFAREDSRFDYRERLLFVDGMLWYGLASLFLGSVTLGLFKIVYAPYRFEVLPHVVLSILIPVVYVTLYWILKSKYVNLALQSMECSYD